MPVLELSMQSCWEMTDYKKESAQGWSAAPAGWTHAREFEPGTKEFFETVIEKRSMIEMPWLAKVIPFEQTRGQKVLELGHGAGYDAYAFCKHGANYTGIDIAPANPPRLRQHLSFYHFEPKVLRGDAENLMFPDNTFDVVFSNGVLHHTPNIAKSFQEAYRVLKPGGEFWVIVYHRDSIFHWWSTVLFNHYLSSAYRTRSYADTLSKIERVEAGGAKPLVNVYSRGQVKHLLKDAGFIVYDIKVRKLQQEDIALPGRIYRRMPKLPVKWLDKIGEYVGWYVIGKARKPS
jgi:ubiquinone/menaquinone biosynthesis C-methylase UbiE